MEISPEDQKRGTVECLVEFAINEDGSLSPTTIDGVSVEEAPAEEESTEEAVPSKESTIADFVQGQMTEKGMQ